MRGRLDEGLGAKLNGAFLIDALERDHSLIVGFWPDFSIAYLNPSAARVMAGQPDAGGTTPSLIGHNLLAFLPKVRRASFDAHVALAPAADDTCSPATIQLEFLSQVPILNAQGCIYPIAERRAFVLLIGAVRTAHGLVALWDVSTHRIGMRPGVLRAVECVHCARIRDQGNVDRWEWRTQGPHHRATVRSASVCAVCFGYYYPHYSEAAPSRAAH